MIDIKVFLKKKKKKKQQYGHRQYKSLPEYEKKVFEFRKKSLSNFRVRIQSEYRKIRTRNNSVFGHFSRSEFYKMRKKRLIIIIRNKYFKHSWLRKIFRNFVFQKIWEIFVFSGFASSFLKYNFFFQEKNKNILSLEL